MADWRDKFREGSFRGVEFKTERHELQGGRRKQDREYAKRDLGNSEDLGRKLKSFKLELLVIGDDYFAQRDALEDALNAEGPGILVHPYKGTLKVQAGLYTMSETVNEGRMARFTVEFSEAGPASQIPSLVIDDLASAVENADSMIDDSKSFFEQVLNTVNQAAFVLNAASAAVEFVADTIEDAITSVTEPIANLTFAISNLKADVDDLIKLPGELADRLASIFDDLLSEFENDPDTARRVMGAFRATIDSDITTSPGGDLAPVIGTTPSRQTQQQNQDAIRNIGIELALATQAQAAVDVDFVSTDAALQSRNDIVGGLDDQIFVIADQTLTAIDPTTGEVLQISVNNDALFQSIKDLQTSLTRALPRVGTSELITFTPPKTLPAIVIAHSLFEDLEKEDEIIDQNQIEHPGFVPGGDEIEVSAG